jgi:hypothetical protein
MIDEAGDNLAQNAGQPQFWMSLVLVYIGGVSAVAMAAVGITFPVSQASVAMSFFPKLTKEGMCLGEMFPASAVSAYQVKYANLAIWGGGFGVLLGFMITKLALNNSATVQMNDRRILSTSLKTKLLQFGARSAILVLTWFVTFDWSGCYVPSPGTSKERMLGGMYALSVSSFLFGIFLILFVSAIYLRRRLG